MKPELQAGIAAVLGCLAFVWLVAAILRFTDRMQSTTRAFKNIAPGEIFFDGDTRYRKLDPGKLSNASAILKFDNAIRADGIKRETKRFEDTDRFEVSVPVELRCALWRRVLIRYSLGWQVGGWTRIAKIAWRAARILSSEQTEMALAAYATSLIMLGDR